MFDQISENLILTDSVFIKQKEYWLDKLSGEIAKTELLSSPGKNRHTGGERKQVRLAIPAETAAQLFKVSRNSDPSLFMILLAVLSSLIHCYSENRDIIVATPVYLPNVHEQTLNHRLLIRLRVDGAMTFRELLLQVRQTALEAFERQDFPLEKILPYLRFRDGQDLQPLTAIGCLLDKIHEDTLADHPEYSLIFSFSRREGQLRGRLSYDAARYETDLITRLLHHFNTFLAEALADVNQRIAGIPFLGNEEKRRLMVELNDTAASYPRDRTLQQLFTRQAQSTPGHTALVCGDDVLSYRELDQLTGQAAGSLRQKGVRPGAIIALTVDRTVPVMVALLGILKVGGTYLPIDPLYPPARTTYMLADSRASLLLTQNTLAASGEIDKLTFPGEILFMDSGEFYSGNPWISHPPGNPLDVAYIIYTSGSTGNPKGVLIEHGSAVNLAYAQQEAFQTKETERILQFSSLCFDASVEQMFVAFISGAVLVLVDKEILLNQRQFPEFLLKQGITHLHAVPSFLNQVEVKEGYPLRRVIAGGDVCPLTLARRWSGRYRFYNEYGPTETTVTSIEYNAHTLPPHLSQVPVGKPLRNTRVYLLNRWRRLTPPGAVGELYIGGAGVARGYLNNPELTAGQFIENPFPPGRDRWYRTGDLARWQRDGNLEFLGRIDLQVKIRGNRIELGEIEQHLLNFGKKNLAGALSLTRPGSTTRRCTRCLISANYPQIRFDEQGVCSLCHESRQYEKYARRYFGNPEDFRDLCKRAGKTGQGDYDCLLLFSGGKDSTYVLYRLVDLGLKVLAFTFDNGYISEAAFENIERLTTHLNVDSLVARSEHMREILAESLYRDHTVCTGCFKALTTLSTKIAAEKGINLIITGLSRGQIYDTKLYGLFKQHIFSVAEIEEKLLMFRKMYHSSHDRIEKLLNVSLEEEIFHRVEFVDFFRYDSTPVREIREFLKSRDSYWNRPVDTGFCSTNCKVNDAGIYVHLKDLGYHNYEGPLSWDCRLGQGERQELLKEVEAGVDVPRVGRILKEIGYGENPIREAVVTAREDGTGERDLCAYYVVAREVDTPALRKYLTTRVPDYMVPAYFIPLDRLPLTPTGKIDRQALPDPEKKAPGPEFLAPRSPVQATLVRLWSDILAMEKEEISINANFFELGGHSLKATILTSKMHKAFHIDVPLAEVFKTPTIEGLAAYIEKSGESAFNAVEAVEKREYYPLSSAQKRLYVLMKVGDLGVTYNIPYFLRLRGDIDPTRLEAVFRHLVSRHDSLRTGFRVVAGEPVQCIREQAPFHLDLRDYSPGRERERGETVPATTPMDRISGEFVRPFDLAVVPLMRVGLARLDRQSWLLMVDLHHIISDGTSMNVLIREFMTIYRGETLPTPKVQYKEFCHWQARVLKKQGIYSQKEYWLRQLAGEITPLQLPTDFVRPALQHFDGSALNFEIGPEDSAALKRLLSREEVTWFLLLLAVTNVFLAKLCQQEDIIIGIPIAGRRHDDLENIVGMFVNSLALRNFPRGSRRFREFLRETKTRTLQAFENQDYQFEELLLNLSLDRDAGRNLLFDVMFLFQNLESPEICLPGLEIEPCPFENRTAKFDLTLSVVEAKDQLYFSLQYSTSLFKAETLRRFTRYFKRIAAAVGKNPDLRLSGIDLLSPEERQQLLLELNCASSRFLPVEPVHENFAARAQENPGKVAVTTEDRNLGYDFLNRCSYGLAQRLGQEYHLGPEDRVVLQMKNRHSLVIALLGVLQAGGAFVVLEADTPARRRRCVCRDCTGKVLVTDALQADPAEDSPGIPLLNIEAIPPPDYISPGGPQPGKQGAALAYLVYKPTVTGFPQGIAVEHASLASALAELKPVMMPGTAGPYLMLSPVSSDSFLLGTFISLTSGATLQVPDSPPAPEGLADWLLQRGIRVINASPAQWSLLLGREKQEGSPRSVDRIAVIASKGEPLSGNLAQQLGKAFPGASLVNLYGAAESGVHALCHQVQLSPDINREPLPLGKPSTRTKIYTLDPGLNQVPVGIPGEIHIGGRGVARGYLNQPELTARHFMINPFNRNSGDRLFRSGDRGKFREDGNVVFTGRRDRQIKFKGYRLRPEEIEQQLCRRPGIREAVVVTREDSSTAPAAAGLTGEKILCAYVVVRPGGFVPVPTPSSLKEALAGELPGYLIPAAVVPLDKIPYRPNTQKVDFNALPPPRAGKREQDEAPGNRIEEILALIWQETLQRERISVNANFFEIGGNSFGLIKVNSKLKEILGIDLPDIRLLEYPTIRSLSLFLQEELGLDGETAGQTNGRPQTEEKKRDR